LATGFWNISKPVENKEGFHEIFVLHVDYNPTDPEQVVDMSKLILDDTYCKFYLLYNKKSKMTGFKLKYLDNKLESKTFLPNAICLFYTHKNKCKDNVTFDVVYEDNILRLLCYIHPDGDKDYLLVGRWRNLSGSFSDMYFGGGEDA